MKKTILLIGAGSILALAVPSCKKPGVKDSPDPQEVKSGVGSGEAETVAAPKSGKKSIAEAVLGYWVPDKEEIMAHMKKEATAAGVPMNPQMVEAMERAASSTILEITPTGYNLYSQGPTVEMSYTLNILEEKTGLFEVSVTHSDGKVEIEKVTIDGDTMRMDRGTMLRITEAEFLARKGEIIKRQRPAASVPSDPGPR